MTADVLPAPLPDGYSLARPTREDLPRILELIRASDVHDLGGPDYSMGELEDDWSAPMFHPSTDSWVVAIGDEGGPLAGYVQLQVRPSRAPDILGWVHPDHRGRGIGTLIVRLAEGRVRELRADPASDLPAVAANWILHDVDAARLLLEAEGYSLRRSFWRMVIELEGAPPPPEWPDGVEVRPMERGVDDRAVHEMSTTAFRDHWNAAAPTYEEWRQRRIDKPEFDPSLWALAVADGRIVGGALCDLEEEEAWVTTLAVQREQRKRGLGMALLRHAFGEFWRRGHRRVLLSVDAENLTGATRLYERAGMRVERQYDRYEKDLAS